MSELAQFPIPAMAILILSIRKRPPFALLSRPF
jgi:hypothetical protein